MSYRVDLTADEIAFIKASVAGVVKRTQERAHEQEAINLTVAAAGAVTRLNEARINHRDVMFLCVCIKKTQEHLRGCVELSTSQNDVAQTLCHQLIRKLEGSGRDFTVLQP
jgi:hypothetical protein